MQDTAATRADRAATRRDGRLWISGHCVLSNKFERMRTPYRQQIIVYKRDDSGMFVFGNRYINLFAISASNKHTPFGQLVVFFFFLLMVYSNISMDLNNDNPALLSPSKRVF
jgi:hypothetical protein